MSIRGAIAWLIGGGGVLFILGFVIYRQATVIDTESNGCFRDRPAVNLFVLVVDQSDPFESADRAVVYKVARDWIRNSSQFDRVVVVAPSTRDPFNPYYLYDRCAPENPSKTSIWTRTKSRIQEPWTRFEKTLMGKVRELIHHNGDPTTPLIETIVAITRNPIFRDAKARRVVIVSDMMQNSAIARFYGNSIPTDATNYVKHLPIGGVGLHRTHIEIWLAARRASSVWNRRGDMVSFWTKWLEESGATVTWHPE